jgi:hypothetical protein
VGFVAKGKLVEEDYLQVIIPAINKAIAEHGKINVLLKLEDFEGWTPKAAKEDFKLITKMGHFEKMAIVGEKNLDLSLKLMFDFLSVLLPPEVSVKFFSIQDYNKALDWLKE